MFIIDFYVHMYPISCFVCNIQTFFYIFSSMLLCSDIVFDSAWIRFWCIYCLLFFNIYFGYCYIYACDVVADKFKPVIYILYSRFYLVPVIDWKRKIISCPPILRVRADDTLSIIGKYTRAHLCDLVHHIQILKDHRETFPSMKSLCRIVNRSKKHRSNYISIITLPRNFDCNPLG